MYVCMYIVPEPQVGRDGSGAPRLAGGPAGAPRGPLPAVAAAGRLGRAQRLDREARHELQGQRRGVHEHPAGAPAPLRQAAQPPRAEVRRAAPAALQRAEVGHPAVGPAALRLAAPRLYVQL